MYIIVKMLRYCLEAKGYRLNKQRENKKVLTDLKKNIIVPSSTLKEKHSGRNP